MQLRIHVNDSVQDIAVPDFMLVEGEEFFSKLDQDMDRGYQMSRTWIDKPTTEQRCQIVADRILTALSNGKQQTATLLAAYILKRAPMVRAIYLNTEGDMTEHDIVTLDKM